ncbi:ABC transporter substrate-binding protein [Leifsonia kafniensis]|uniref:ABC transporter substrate-binding protein n=1 Tax=Leifsonia kafniensis TaxID=475957 RepID=A0ABP7KMK1_9MICO
MTASAGCSAQAENPASGTDGRILKVGIAGDSAGTTLDPHALYDTFGTVFANTFFEQLGEFDENGEYRNVLAASFTPNDDATSWQLTLKDGVTFHDGDPLTSEDVIFSFERVMDPATAAVNLSATAVIEEMTKIDDLTVRFDLLRPVASFPEIIAAANAMGIVEPDFDPKHPVSTGPWVFESFGANGMLVLARSEHYHGTAPALAGLELVALPDDDARTNALLTGQIDADLSLQPSQVARFDDLQKLSVLELPAGGIQMITMRVDEGVTADARVRQALRLSVDRQRVLDVAFGGFGRIGNDLYGIDDPAFRSDLVRERDVDAAKKLIKEAGVEGAELTLVTLASVEPIAQIVAQNAQEIGLDVTVQVKDDTTFYAQGYLDYQFAVDNWPGSTILNVASMTDAPGASLPYTHMNDAEFNEAFESAMASTDADVRTEALSTMQEILFERGGFIIPAIGSTLAAVPANTTGWPTGDPSGLGLYRALKDVSFTS